MQNNSDKQLQNLSEIFDQSQLAQVFAEDDLDPSTLITHISHCDFEGGEDGVEEDPDDIDNIDFNNYKGIYADDDAGQKYTCPETGAHFEPKDLCKRLYRVVEKMKPREYELYGQPMLLDLVGSSLLADAPYAPPVEQIAMAQKQGSIDQGVVYKKVRQNNFSHSYQKNQSSSSNGPSHIRQQNYQVPNARAGSMKQQQDQLITNQIGVNQHDLQRQNKNNAINEAYEGQMQSVAPNVAPAGGYVKNNSATFEGKVRQKTNGSNADQCVSSSLMSEKVDHRLNMVNFSNGNQKNIKFKNKFGEEHGSFQQQASSKSPQKNRLQTQPEPPTQQQMRLMTAQLGQRGSNNHNQMNLLGGMAKPLNQNSRNNQLIGPQSQSLSMHIGGAHQKTQLAPGNQKSLSIGSNAFNNAATTSQGGGGNNMQTFTALHQYQGQSRQPATNSKGLPSRMSTTGGKSIGQGAGAKQSIHNSNILKQQSHDTSNHIQNQHSKRAQSQGQNLQASADRSYPGASQKYRQNTQMQGMKAKSGDTGVQKTKDAYTLIQEQQRAEQARQPQNQFEHQENILKQLNSDEVYDKLMKIFKEREALYSQMEQEKATSRDTSPMIAHQLQQQQKNSSAEPVIRNHQNTLMGGPQLSNSTFQNNIKGNPYQEQQAKQKLSHQNQQQMAIKQNKVIGHVQQQQFAQQQQLPLQLTSEFKLIQNNNQNQLKFQQYVMNQGQTQTGNSRNQVLKSGIGGRLNTKNTNNQFVSGGSIGGNVRMTAQGGFSGNNVVGQSNALKQSMNKSIQLSTNNFYNNGQQQQINQQTISSSNNRVVSSGKQHDRQGALHIGSGSTTGLSIGTNSQKITKKKAQNLSSSQQNGNLSSNNVAGGKSHQSQISLNNMNLGGPNQPSQPQFNNSFYGKDVGAGTSATTIHHKQSAPRSAANQHPMHGSMRNNHSNGHQQQMLTGTPGNSNTALLNGQQSKNEIIAKYMKSINTSNGANIGTSSQGGIQKVRQQSSGLQHAANTSSQNNDLSSQYNNFMKSVANQHGLKNPMLPSQSAAGHSRNYQNNLGASSKTHTESMIYNNKAQKQMGGSFNQVISQSIHSGFKQSQNKTMHNQGGANHSLSNGGNASGIVNSASGRPVTSYSGKAISKKKHNNMSDPHHQSNLMMGHSGNPGSFQQQQMSSYGQQRNAMHVGGGGPSSNAHVINQSLKPKMILNNNNNNQSAGGDKIVNMQDNVQIMIDKQQQLHMKPMTNAVSGGRPQSSKIIKKKAGASNSHSSNNHNQQNQHSIYMKDHHVKQQNFI